MTTDTELQQLKNLADEMGLPYHPNIGADKLREKIAEAQDAAENAEDKSPQMDDTAPAVDESVSGPKDPAKDPLALVRCVITCMDPTKRDLESEIFTIGNAVIPTQKRCIPFDTEWHVPRMMLNMIKNKKCQIFKTKKGPRGVDVPVAKQINAYAVQELAPLTEKERKEIAQLNRMASGDAEALD